MTPASRGSTRRGKQDRHDGRADPASYRVQLEVTLTGIDGECSAPVVEPRAVTDTDLRAFPLRQDVALRRELQDAIASEYEVFLTAPPDYAGVARAAAEATT